MKPDGFAGNRKDHRIELAKRTRNAGFDLSRNWAFVAFFKEKSASHANKAVGTTLSRRNGDAF